MIRLIVAAVLLTAGAALAGTPLRPLQLDAARTAEARAKAEAGPATGPATIARLQTAAAARAAHQELIDAVNAWTAEGEALTHAAARAALGEIAPTAREHTSCLDRDCAPVSPKEHAALVVIGAVGPVFDLKDWPAEEAHAITLYPDTAPSRTVVRTLRADPAATVAKAGVPSPLEQALDDFGDAGRAVQRAALLAGRGYVLTAAGKGLAICRSGACEPTSGLEAAAFVVIGAAVPGTETSLARWIEITPDRRWVFRSPR